MSARIMLAVLALAVASACSNSPTAPTTPAEVPDPITTPVTVTYPGVLGAGGTASRAASQRRRQSCTCGSGERRRASIARPSRRD